MMRLGVGALIAVALASPAHGQELGLAGVTGQVWDAGTAYHLGWGISFGLLTKPSETRNRTGLRVTYDVLRADADRSVPIPEFTPEIGFDVVDGPRDAPKLKVVTVRWVFLPQITRDARAEFGVGGAREEGRNARGNSALLSAGLAHRVGTDGPYWMSLSYEQRYNPKLDPRDFDNPTRRMRGALRLGIVLEARRSSAD